MKDGAGSAGVDGFSGAGEAFAEIGGDADGFEGGGGVEKYDVAPRSRFGAGENGFENGGVGLRGVAALQFGQFGPGQANVFGIDKGGDGNGRVVIG